MARKKRIHVSLGKKPHALVKEMAKEEDRTLEKTIDRVITIFYEYREFLKEQKAAR